MKNFVSVSDVPDINALVHKALSYKSDPSKDRLMGAHKRLGLLFLNPSMRTRLSTQIAASNLGTMNSERPDGKPFNPYVLTDEELEETKRILIAGTCSRYTARINP